MSVSRKSRPTWLNVSCVWSMPSRCSVVACRSGTYPHGHSSRAIISTALTVAVTGRLPQTLISKTALSAAPVHGTPNMGASLWGESPLYENCNSWEGSILTVVASLSVIVFPTMKSLIGQMTAVCCGLYVTNAFDSGTFRINY